MKTLFFSVCLFLASVSATAQQRYSQEMAQSQGKQWTHGKSWDYVNGLVAKSLLNLCEQYQYADWTGNYYQWAKEYADKILAIWESNNQTYFQLSPYLQHTY